MKSNKLLLALLAATTITSACAKKTDNNTDSSIQKVVDQTNADNKADVEKIKSAFEQSQNEIEQIAKDATLEADESLATLQKSTLNYVDKMIRVDILDENGIQQKSYLDIFELDGTSGSYKSKFETMMSNEAAGICINLASLECETSSNFKKLAQTAGTTTAGRFKPTKANEAFYSRIPDIQIESNTKVTKLERDFMLLQLTAKMNAGGSPQEKIRTIRISTVGKLSQEKHNFFQLTEDKSDRKDISEVESDLKRLSSSTVQVLLNSEGGSILHGGGSSHGTGFFISDDGLMLTNNHVAVGLTKCMTTHKCKAELRQVSPENQSTVYVVDAQLLVTDISMDFALFKISVPAEMKIQKLEIEDKEVDADLMTLGYPADRGQTRETTPLTYSFGKLVGTFDLGYSTSVYLSGGASGSAMLNKATQKVVGLVSNAGIVEAGESGSPGIARPIQMINAKFGIEDYLNGSKEVRVTKILQMLKVSSNVTEAQKALNAFESERTYLGLNVMKSVMLSHQDFAVRKVIMQYLEKHELIMGPDQE
ncbi:S1 family peptidase [Bdellovibrio sp. HCB288]|uniref:S1 family peptidase n=1 Tax=Bdellovibrio sp. HCB288 TaxID=3394355 RepID=UPI0039B4A7F5